MGHYINVFKKPEYKSIEACKKAMRKQAPTLGMEDLIDMDDITCDCCGKKAPYLAAAIINIEDQTPTTVSIQQKNGDQVEICANCFYFGVRPKYSRFGKVEWNSEGDKVQAMAESNTGIQW